MSIEALPIELKNSQPTGQGISKTSLVPECKSEYPKLFRCSNPVIDDSLNEKSSELLERGLPDDWSLSLRDVYVDESKVKSGKELTSQSPCELRLKTLTKFEKSTWRPSYSIRSNWDAFFDSQAEIESPSRNCTTEGSDWGTEVSELVLGKRKSSEWTLSSNSPVHSPVSLTVVNKSGMRNGKAPINMRIEELVKWLNEGNLINLPLCEYNPWRNPRLRPKENFQNLTILEAFGDNVNFKTQRLLFFVGPVEGKLCYKMEVCDVDKHRASKKWFIAAIKDKPHSERKDLLNSPCTPVKFRRATR